MIRKAGLRQRAGEHAEVTPTTELRPDRLNLHGHPGNNARVVLHPHGVRGLQERRRRRRAKVPPMYTSAIVRMLAKRGEPLEGHVIDISETGISVEVDSLIPVSQAVTVEFRIAGLGRIAGDEWSEYAAAGIIVRHDNLDDFPSGPYRMAIKFARISTMSQAQIARFVATRAE
jgi:c-di-GMP-binding flagellar brake protein YcgR